MPLPEFVSNTPQIDRIDVGPGRRPLNNAAVASLAESIAAIGLQSPITVKFSGGRFTLITGAHRLAACKLLEWERIPAFFSEMSERDARLWEISENLHRAELTAGERADQIAEWIRITTDDLQSRQVDAIESRRADGRGHRPEGGAAAAARSLPGVTERGAQRAVRIASIAPEAREAAREAGLDDNQSALLRVAAAPREQQVEAVAGIVEARAAPRETPPTIVLDASEYMVEPSERPGNESLSPAEGLAVDVLPRLKQMPHADVIEFVRLMNDYNDIRMIEDPDGYVPALEAFIAKRGRQEEMLESVVAKAKEMDAPVVEVVSGITPAPVVEVVAAVDSVPEPELDRTAPWTFPLPAPGKLDVAALVKPLLAADDTPKARADRRRARLAEQRAAA